MVGDKRFRRGHGVCWFGDVDIGDLEARKIGQATKKGKLTRSVVLSASLQMDFEAQDVMLRVCMLDENEIVGVDLGLDGEWILSTEEKQGDGKREAYDYMLKRHMVFHLMRSGRLPARRDALSVMDITSTIRFLEQVINGAEDIEENIDAKYSKLDNGEVVSLEFLLNTASHQVRNEFSALEALCPQGYVYTYDPASIFAHEIGAEI